MGSIRCACLPPTMSKDNEHGTLWHFSREEQPLRPASHRASHSSKQLKSTKPKSKPNPVHHQRDQQLPAPVLPSPELDNLPTANNFRRTSGVPPAQRSEQQQQQQQSDRPEIPSSSAHVSNVDPPPASAQYVSTRSPSDDGQGIRRTKAKEGSTDSADQATSPYPSNE